MGTSKAEIRSWLQRGVQEGATHCIVVCDTYDHEDYPHYVSVGEDPRDYKPGEMQRIMEVYALHLDIESQLAEHRAFHYESAPEPTTLPVLSTATPERVGSWRGKVWRCHCSEHAEHVGSFGFCGGCRTRRPERVAKTRTKKAPKMDKNKLDILERRGEFQIGWFLADEQEFGLMLGADMFDDAETVAAVKAIKNTPAVHPDNLKAGR